MDNLPFEAQEWLRYTRHIQLNGFGAKAQARLKNSRVMVIGLGGLGCPVASYLAAAGVGELILIDGDRVDITNLQRQVLYATHNVGEYKAEVARQKLSELNTDITIQAHCAYFCWSMAENFSEIDLVVDCTDNFATRYLINDFCLSKKISWLYASVSHYSGQCALFQPGGPCFRCLFPAVPDKVADCNSAGILGTVPGMLGIIQANEAILQLCKGESALSNKLLLLDLNTQESRKITLVADDNCVCRLKNIAVDMSAEEYRFHCQEENLDDEQLVVSANEFSKICHDEDTLVIDVRSHAERELFHIGGEHIPQSEIDRIIDSLDKNTTILCYCQTGKRSLAFAKKMHERGYNAKSLCGGLVAMLKGFLYQGA